ncbi:hypothetical protein VTI74DRAFT_1295 [Chaetomium olivicolor]
MSGPSLYNDAFFYDLPPLPEGWDWNRVMSAEPAELCALPDDQQSLIRAHREARVAQWRGICGADDAAAHRRSQMTLRTLERDELTPDELAVVERFGLPREQVGTPLFEIAEVMHRQECEYWGFVTFRVHGYGSAAPRWDEFMRRWHKMMNDRLGRLILDGIKNTGLRETDEGAEAHFQDLYAAAAAGGIMSRWQLMVREHEEINGIGPQEVRTIFREMLKLDEEEDESLPNRVPIGVDPGLCLIADEGVVSSLLDEREGRKPYIVGVLSDIYEAEIPDEAEAVHFKIALESVVDLWRQIQVRNVYDLVPPEGKIYISPGVFEDDV